MCRDPQKAVGSDFKIGFIIILQVKAYIFIYKIVKLKIEKLEY